MTDDDLKLAIRAQLLKDVTPSSVALTATQEIQNEVMDDFIALLLSLFTDRRGDTSYNYTLSPYTIQKITAALRMYDQVIDLKDGYIG